MYDDDGYNFNELQCFKHGFYWHSKFQHLLNILRPKIAKQNLYKLCNAVCTCGLKEDEIRFLPEKLQEKIRKRPKDTRWEEQITKDVETEMHNFFHEFIDTHYTKTSDEYGHLKNIFQVLKDRDQFLELTSSANRFFYAFYRLFKFNDDSMLNPPPQPVDTMETEVIEKIVLKLETLRPEDVGNFIGRNGLHIKKLLKEKKGSKITMGKEDGHVKIEIEAKKNDVEAIKERLLEREKVVNQARRQHEENVRQYIETGGEPSDMDYQSAEDNMDE